MTKGLMSWRLVFNGSQTFKGGHCKDDARVAAMEWGYQFYLWMGEVYWTETDEKTSITVEDLF
jgi:hypothetical protein